MESLTIITEPTLEPLTLTEGKTHLRVVETAEDDYIEANITAARMQVENFTNLCLITTTFRLNLDRFPARTRLPWPECAAIEIPRPPLQSVTSITYVDVNGVTQTLATTEYQVDSDCRPARIVPAYGKTWPATRQQLAAVKVTYVAGYETAEEIPSTLRTAVRWALANMFENRNPVEVGTIAAELPLSLQAVMAPHRVMRFVPTVPGGNEGEV